MFHSGKILRTKTALVTKLINLFNDCRIIDLAVKKLRSSGDTCRMKMADLSDPNNPKILEVSRITGHFNYHEDGKLFAADPNIGQCPTALAPELAESFLTDHGLLPADAGAYSVGFDTITEKNLDTNDVLQTFYQNTNVAYARQIFADSRDTIKV